ncbi:hypothetical protein GPECTOR_1365g592 [Gonium pectorale]|uniref:Uncharacterized protein n=1 Tax=Gonium pectorale TaxID=33097 RepID=A0A150FTG3_GONPE|nr:hypothetical protein GPECTOR_1365g592 [Gonium pectorale]|eukprot:KXZ40911.1 hypothetical protein GPECTOR_1365g592 [Gonium pectorale]
MYKKFFASVGTQAKSVVEALPQTLAEGVQQKKLQKEAQVRLNEMCDQLRSMQSVDLSAKNLGDEGTAYGPPPRVARTPTRRPFALCQWVCNRNPSIAFPAPSHAAPSS